MSTSKAYLVSSGAQKPPPGNERRAFPDPWAETTLGYERREVWMLSYIDILTVLLTLFVVLLVLQPKNELPATGDIAKTTGFALPVSEGRTKNNAHRQPNVVNSRPDPLLESVHGILNMTLSERLSRAGSGIVQAPEIPTDLFADDYLIASSGPTQPKLPRLIQKTEARKLAYPAEAFANVGQDNSVPEPFTQKPKSNKPAVFGALLKKLADQSMNRRLKVSQIAEGVHLEVRDNILFSRGSSQLKPEGRMLLNDLADILLQHKGTISVEGHTDDRPISSGRYPSNWELSSGRATSVTRYLIGHGLSPSKLRAVGYADTRPLESNHTATGRARNRRVSLVLELPQGPIRNSNPG